MSNQPIQYKTKQELYSVRVGFERRTTLLYFNLPKKSLRERDTEKVKDETILQVFKNTIQLLEEVLEVK